MEEEVSESIPGTGMGYDCALSGQKSSTGMRRWSDGEATVGRVAVWWQINLQGKAGPQHQQQKRLSYLKHLLHVRHRADCSVQRT